MRYLFKHILLRDAVYDIQLRTHLRQLHHKAAQAIEELHANNLPPYYADLAYHYGAADLLEQERCYAILAGKQAAFEYANDTALRFLGRALELTLPDNWAARYDLLSSREEIYDLQGKRELEAQDIIALKELAERLNDDVRRAEALLRESAFAYRTSDYPACATAALQATALAQKIQNVEIEATGRLRCGAAWLRLSDYAKAQTLSYESLTLAETCHLYCVEAEALRQLGIIAYDQGNYDLAKNYCNQALVRYQELNDLRGESGALNNLGLVAYQQGDYQQAQICYTYSLATYRKMGDLCGEAKTLSNLGLIAMDQGNAAVSLNYLEQALLLCKETNDHYGQSAVLENLGSAADYIGNYADAMRYYEQALELCHMIGNRAGEATNLAYLGLLLHHLGDNETATDYARQAYQIAQEFDDRPTQAVAQTFLGHALAGLEEWEAATTAYQTALALRRELAQPNQCMEIIASLARIALAQNELVRAKAYTEGILDHQTAGHTFDGADEPLRIHLTCALVLLATGDTRAMAILNTAYDLLQERAAKIGGKELKESFWNNVAVHREIVDMFNHLARSAEA